MSKHSEKFRSITEEMNATQVKKGADYGAGEDPLANLRASEAWGVPAWVGALMRACDKIKRMQSYYDNGTLANEGLIDAFNDLAVYAVLGRMLYEEAVADGRQTSKKPPPQQPLQRPAKRAPSMSTPPSPAPPPLEGFVAPPGVIFYDGASQLQEPHPHPSSIVKKW